MVHDLTSNDKYRGASYEGNESNLRGYGSARGRMTGSHGRSALSRLTGYLSSLVEAVADAKMRRVRRELELFAAFAWISRTRYGSQLAARAQSMIRTRVRSGNDTPATSPKTSFLNTIYIGLLAFLFPTWYGPERKYHPEDHYMRGPGPKWRAKHAPDRPQTD